MIPWCIFSFRKKKNTYFLALLSEKPRKQDHIREVLAMSTQVLKLWSLNTISQFKKLGFLDDRHKMFKMSLEYLATPESKEANRDS